MEKSERLKIFLERLSHAAPADSSVEAFRLLCDLLNQVEDEYSASPFNPESWETDGRMYPPQSDHCTPHPERAGVMRYRSVRHYTFIGADGMIEITDLLGNMILHKDGA